jgi:hypothetical protein
MAPMVRLINSGMFRLMETNHGIKLLELNRKIYAWIVAPRIGSLLIYSVYPHKIVGILSRGHFKLYYVVDEPQLSDDLHLEVEVGGGAWQGYRLLTGLPDRVNTRKPIMPTRELISLPAGSSKPQLTH